MNNWLTTTLLATVAATGGIAEAAPATNSETALKKRIEAFRNAGDARDANTMTGILHRDFRLTVFFGDATDGVSMDKAGYSGALSAGKIGGVKRELEIISVEVRGNHAACRLRMSSSELKFENYMHWVMVAGEWQLLNDLTHAVPQKK
jgi:hypothetical protein